MKRKIFPAVAFAAFMAVGVSVVMAQSGESDPRPTDPNVEKTRDPVCKMMVRKDPELSAEHAGRTYYFCMRKDLEAFEKDPEKYLEDEPHSHPDPAAGKRSSFKPGHSPERISVTG